MATIQETLSNAAQLHHAGNLRPAELLYRQVLHAEPDHVHALSNLAILCTQADRPEEGLVHLRRAMALQPELAELHTNLAACFKTLHDIPAAVAEYREALRLKPASAHVHVNLAQALIDLGQVDEALALGLAALRLQPGFPSAYGILGTLAAQGWHAFADQDIRDMEAACAHADLSPDDAALLHFTLAAHWEKQGDYDAAFRGYRQANDLKREILRLAGKTFDPEQHRARVDTFLAAFTPDFFAQARPFGVETERPIFVVGMVRSGTSLVEQILASHPQVHGCGELKDIEQMAGSFYSAFIGGAHPQIIRAMADRYLQRLASHDAQALRTIDKMPNNFVHLGMIAVLFPRARVIHCRRDPLDVCVSAYVQDFQHLFYATSLADIGFYYRHYERLMEHWRRVLPLRMHEVRYEDLVANQARVTRELVAFCGLPWDDRCLTFHKNPRAVQTPSRLQVRQPIYTHAVARWKRFDAHLQPLRDALEAPEGAAALEPPRGSSGAARVDH